MTTPTNPDFARTVRPPVMEARRWLDGVTFSTDQPLINVSQAAPVQAPPLGLRQALADAALNEDAAHLYGPVLGMPELRGEIAARWSTAYQGHIKPDQVAITAGCNQAFCAAIATLAQKEDEVILPTPWYFNHKMFLDMQGIAAIPLQTGADMLPNPQHAADLITDKTRAIVLVTPNNPAGVEYPAALVRAFYTLAKSRGLALIVDETYRDFDSRTGPPHDLFGDKNWHQTLIQLYSFSKAFRLTGHRVGALIAGEDRMIEIEKYLDTTAICPNQLGQRGALWGLQNLAKWLSGERDEILSRRRAIQDGFKVLEKRGWKLLGCGAYFAYVRHPFDMPSSILAPELVDKAGILLLPGTMFKPENDPTAESELRIAYANIDIDGIHDLFSRLQGLQF